ncbi:MULTISPECIES: hypothetical protein [unclassified Pseudoalteromonas]|nr:MULTISPECIES: hypothetical protein [unclassified Pseudoalteromonas]
MTDITYLFILLMLPVVSMAGCYLGFELTKALFSRAFPYFRENM